MFKKSFFLAILFTVYASCNSPSEGDWLKEISSEQVSQLTGTYKASVQEETYTVIVSSFNASQKDSKDFIIIGFFEKQKENFFNAIQPFISKNLSETKKIICMQAEEETKKYCQQKSASDYNICTKEGSLRLGAEAYFRSLREYGILFVSTEKSRITKKISTYESFGGYLQSSGRSSADIFWR